MAKPAMKLNPMKLLESTFWGGVEKLRDYQKATARKHYVFTNTKLIGGRRSCGGGWQK